MDMNKNEKFAIMIVDVLQGDYKSYNDFNRACEELDKKGVEMGIEEDFYEEYEGLMNGLCNLDVMLSYE